MRYQVLHASQLALFRRIQWVVIDNENLTEYGPDTMNEFETYSEATRYAKQLNEEEERWKGTKS